MSLRFAYRPLPDVRFVRRQTISFFVGTPSLEFVAQKKDPAPREMIESKASREPRRSDKPPKPPKPPKVSKPSKSSFRFENRSLAACHALMVTLSHRSAIDNMWDLRDPDTQKPYANNLTNVKRKLVNCVYASGDAFITDISAFFSLVAERFEEELGRTAKRYKQEIVRAYETAPETERAAPVLKKALDRMAHAHIGVHGARTEPHDVREIAQKLNSLDEESRLRAEWIVRMHCPALPHFSRGVDVTQLPQTALDALRALIDE